MKHTPGPWNVEKNDKGQKILDDAQTGSWTTLATAHVSEDLFNQGSRRISHSEAQANAHLIAAAPELLEAAMNLLSSLEETEFGCFDGFGKRDQENTKAFYNRRDVKALVQAIAKVRGES